jgi:hypothetical protein
MSIKGTAAKSASGAAMSKYDVEVESRLKALEAKANAPVSTGGDTSELEAKVDAIIGALKSKMPGQFKDL